MQGRQLLHKGVDDPGHHHLLRKGFLRNGLLRKGLLTKGLLTKGFCCCPHNLLHHLLDLDHTLPLVAAAAGYVHSELGVLQV